MNDLDSLIKQINNKNWWVSYLFQDGKNWNAGLRPADDFTLAHGVGKTIEEAVTNAMSKMKHRKTDKDWKQIKDQQPVPKSKARIRLK